MALVGFSAYGALVLCAALGPGNAGVLALLCLGAACGIALFRVALGVVGNHSVKKELSEELPKALFVSRKLFWIVGALLVAGLLCGRCVLAWEKIQPLQELAGQKFQIRAQLLDYPEERYHRYYYKLRVESLAQEGEAPRLWSPLPCGCRRPCPLPPSPTIGWSVG